MYNDKTDFSDDLVQSETNMKKEEKLHQEIQAFFDEKKFTFVTDIKSVKTSSQKITFICCCGEEKTKMFKDIKRNRECRTCKSKKYSEVPTDLSVCPSDNPDEKWVAIEGGFISSLGNAVGIYGKPMSLDEKGRYFFNGKLQYATILMAKAFKLDGHENLEGQKGNSIVRNQSQDLKPMLEQLAIGTRNDVGKENGIKSHKSEKFKEAMAKDLVKYIEEYSYKRLDQFPDYIFFETGSIYNNSEGQGGKRFFTFSHSNTNANNSKDYLRLCCKEKTYKVHKLICMAFHPIEGKANYDDYKDLQVNHKDGNTLNNHESNLEWVSSSQNMKHAYNTDLNKKVRAVHQYENDKGKFGNFIKEFKSLAEASRETKIPEHEIRSICKSKASFDNKQFLWKYKNEEENEEWAKKYAKK